MSQQPPPQTDTSRRAATQGDIDNVRAAVDALRSNVNVAFTSPYGVIAKLEARIRALEALVGAAAVTDTRTLTLPDIETSDNKGDASDAADSNHRASGSVPFDP